MPRIAFLLYLTMSAVLASPLIVWAEDLPTQLTDEAFWTMVSEFSEEGGQFRSDNFSSNEDLFQFVIPTLIRTTKPGGVYLGVGPEQNFTYIVALQPKIAFIFDIRRQNLLEHLMYKAVFEMAADRADFMSLLFSRERPSALDTLSTADALFRAFRPVVPDRALYSANLREITDLLVQTHGFKLSGEDLDRIEYVYNAFFEAGPDLNYSFRSTNAGFGRMPTYSDLMTATDESGEKRSFLATEENFLMLKEMQKKNLIVPLVGDFAGPTAIRTVAQYLKDHEASVTAFYLSNVEQYLFQTFEWTRFYGNVSNLPIDSTSTFIRSVSNSTRVQPRPANYRFLSVLSPMMQVVEEYAAGRIRKYDDVIRLSQ